MSVVFTNVLPIVVHMVFVDYINVSVTSACIFVGVCVRVPFASGITFAFAKPARKCFTNVLLISCPHDMCGSHQLGRL